MGRLRKTPGSALGVQWVIEDVLAYVPADVQLVIESLVGRHGEAKVARALADVERARDVDVERHIVTKNAKDRADLLAELDAIIRRAGRVLGGSSDGPLLWWLREGSPLVKRAAQSEAWWKGRRRAGRPGHPTLGFAGYLRLVQSFRDLGASKHAAEKLVRAIRARPIARE